MVDEKETEEKGESFQEKVSEKMGDLRKNEKVEELFQFARSNTRDTIAYIVLFIGIIMLLFRPFWGGLAIGVIGGVYFANELFGFFQNLNQFIEKHGLIKCLILGGVALGLFIEAPYIFVGGAISIAVMQMIAPKSS